MRSRQTGHVGNSIREGVGGARGFVDNVAEGIELDWFGEEILARWGLDAEWGALISPDEVPGSTAWISTVFTKTTWQVSGLQ